jgi:hypothetical protein
VDAGSSELLDGYIVRHGRGSQFIVRLEDGREIKAIPLLEAVEVAECPSAPIVNRRVQVCMYKHPKFHRIIKIGRPNQ